MNPYRQLGGQTLIYGMGNVVPRILNYAIMTFYYTRRFSVEEFGMITELYAYVAILLVILTYGMETGFFKFSSEAGTSKLHVFHTTAISIFCTSLFFVILVVIKKDAIAGWMGYGGNPEYISYMAGILAADAMAAIVFAKLRIENRVRRFAILKLINVGLTIALVLLFLEFLPRMGFITDSLFYEEKLKAIGVGYVLIANLIASVILLLILLGEFKSRNIFFDRSLYIRLLKYSLPLLAAGLAGMFNETLDRILLRRLVAEPLQPLYELGIYGANYRIAVLMTLFVQMFRYAAEPFFFNRVKSKDAKQVYADVLKYFTIFMMIIFLLVTLYIDVFKFFIDPKFFDGLRIVPIVLFANILVGMLFNVNMWYKLSGKTYYGVMITAAGALITVILNIVFIPLYSYMAAAWAHVVCNFVMLTLTYFTGRKFYRIDYDLKRIGTYVLLGLAIYGLSVLMRTEHMGINLAIGSALLLIYLIYCNNREKLMDIFVIKK